MPKKMHTISQTEGGDLTLESGGCGPRASSDKQNSGGVILPNEWHCRQ